ncbi:MAG: MotA/TolQ/ExbB proton channel family protein [Pirellulaceae bacterium]|nr:MotA/TolQ/ExbB proton channel family protein [Pirellulaceae bacterium]
MAKTKRVPFFGVILDSIGWPLIAGLAGTTGFYLAIRQGIITNELIIRYTAGHPVEYVEVCLFFIGLAAILRRGWQTMRQLGIAEAVQLDPPPAEGQAPHEAKALLTELAELPTSIRKSQFVQRIENALAFIGRQESADNLDDELKYLSETDAERNYEAYGLVRMIIWATPMLGFLGTVIGITLALGDLSPEALVNSPKVAMEGLLSGLSVAFDTTALALSLSIALMFTQFLMTQVDTQLLSIVDRRTSDLLGNRFRKLGTERDPHLASVERMSQSVMNNMTTIVERQSEVWKTSLDAAHDQWAKLMTETGDSVESAVSTALTASMTSHTENLLKLEDAAGARAAAHWQQLQESANETIREVRAQQVELTKHGEINLQVLQATGDIMKLEQALNQNLRALSGAKNFEDTVMSLSAAIQLLSSRLGRPLAKDQQVQLESPQQERAA